MRILIVHSYYGQFGGGEVYVRSFIDLLRSHGHEIFLFSFTEGREIARDTELILRDAFYDKNQNPGIYFVRYLLRFYIDPWVITRLRPWIRVIRPDVIHIHANDRYGISVLLALRNLDIPIVQSVHAYTLLCMSPTSKMADDRICLQSLGLRCFAKGCLNLKIYLSVGVPYAVKGWLTKKSVDIIVAPNAMLEKRLQHCGYHNISRIDHFVEDFKNRDINSFNDIEPGNILCIGRLTEEKGVQYVILVFAKLIKDIPTASLHICGEGPFHDRLMNLVQEFHLEDRVHFHGFVTNDELQGYYRRANLVIFPSICLEICGLVNLEALASARPLIISNRCGISDLFEGYNQNFIIDITNTRLLQHRIMDIFQDPFITRQLGLQGRKIYENKFSPEVHYQGVIELYSQLVKKH